MKKSYTVLIFLLCIPALSFGAIYKCEENGKISYSNIPCPSTSIKHKLQIKSFTPSVSFQATGFVMENDKRMTIQDAVAIYDQQGSDSYEVRVFLYPFKNLVAMIKLKLIPLMAML